MKEVPVFVLVCCCALFATIHPAHAEDGRFYGMLRERDLSPFGYLRLDMRPGHAISIEPHSFAFEMELGYQNTLNAPKTQGFTDPVFGLRYTGFKLPGRWQISVEVAAKVPLEGERMLLSTGRTDYGMQTSVRHLGERNAFHMDLAAVYYAGETIPAPHDD